MEEIKNNRTKLIRARVTEDEVALIKTKAKYYGYKNLSKYLIDAAVNERVTHFDLKGKKEIYDAYSDNTKEIKKFVKEIKHLNKYATQLNNLDIRRITTLMFEIIRNQKNMLKLIGEKLDYNVWQEINRKNEMQEGDNALY